MSVRPGLIAASRVGVPSTALRAQWIRCASDSAGSSAPKRAAPTVQDADREIKERQRMMRRAPRGFDYVGAYGPIVFEPIVDPAWKLQNLFKYKPKYVWERLKRSLQTAQMASKFLIDLDLVDTSNRTFVQKLGEWFSRPSTRLMIAMKEPLEDVYKRYNEAQASGDLVALKNLSMGPALDRATTVAKALSGKKGKWRFIRHVTPPRVVSVRTGPMDMQGKKTATQITLQFNTEQEFTGPKREPKISHVREYIVFDRSHEPSGSLKIKDFVKETSFDDPAAREKRA